MNDKEPTKSTPNDRMDQIISFLMEIEKFKAVEREIWIPNLNRKETDAEHTWHVAMFAILFDKEIPKEVDRVKLLKLILTHDLVEIYAGDTFAFASKEEKLDKEKKEQEAIHKLAALLPEDLKEELIELFLEYEHRETPEAIYAQSFDKIQPMLQNLTSNGMSYQHHQLSFDTINSYNEKYLSKDPFVQEFYRRIYTQALDRGFFSDSSHGK